MIEAILFKRQYLKKVVYCFSPQHPLPKNTHRENFSHQSMSNNSILDAKYTYVYVCLSFTAYFQLLLL